MCPVTRLLIVGLALSMATFVTTRQIAAEVEAISSAPTPFSALRHYIPPQP